jgi:hypothetical protein
MPKTTPTVGDHSPITESARGTTLLHSNKPTLRLPIRRLLSLFDAHFYFLSKIKDFLQTKPLRASSDAHFFGKSHGIAVVNRI